MTFRAAVRAIPALVDAYRSGIQALSRADRDRIVCSNTRRLRGSVDIDAALVEALPNDPRWDYGIGHYNGKTEEAIWVEVHPASSNHVSRVIQKAKWLRAWLGENAAALLGITRDGDGYVWLSSGTVSIQRGSRQAKKLAMAGVSFPRRRLELK